MNESSTIIIGTVIMVTPTPFQPHSPSLWRLACAHMWSSSRSIVQCGLRRSSM